METDLNQTVITATANGIVSKLNLRNPGQTDKQLATKHGKLLVSKSHESKTGSWVSLSSLWATPTNGDEPDTTTTSLCG